MSQNVHSLQGGVGPSPAPCLLSTLNLSTPAPEAEQLHDCSRLALSKPNKDSIRKQHWIYDVPPCPEPLQAGVVPFSPGCSSS